MIVVFGSWRMELTQELSNVIHWVILLQMNDLSFCLHKIIFACDEKVLSMSKKINFQPFYKQIMNFFVCDKKYFCIESF